MYQGAAYFFLVFSVTCIAVTNCYVQVCYVTSWSQYRPGQARFTPDKIDPFLCTHVIYSFMSIRDGKLSTWEWNDVQVFTKINALKSRNPSMKSMVAVGGWIHDEQEGHTKFTEMVADYTSREKFIKSTIQFLRKHDLDGLDIDWEYPGTRGSPPTDKAKFTSFCDEMRRAFHEEAYLSRMTPLLLTAAIPASSHYLKPGYDLEKLTLSVDWFNLMAYDLHGSWEGKTSHNTAMVNTLMNVSYGVDYLIKERGVPSNQIALGLAPYGQSFTLQNKNNHGIGAKTVDAGRAGKYTRTKGILSYFEACTFPHQVDHLNSEERAPYAYNGDQWVGYDTPESIQYKVLLEVVSKHLRGTMFWDIAFDDFDGVFCGNGKFPLLNAAKGLIDKEKDITELLEKVVSLLIPV